METQNTKISKQDKINKIFDLIEKYHISNYEISKNTGISEAGLGSITNKETKNPREVTVNAIYNYLISKYIKDRITYESEPESAPYYENISASAGLSYLMDNSSKPEHYIKIPGSGVDAYINVFGDSMYPKYCSGEIIGIKSVEKDFVFFGNAYVIEMGDGEAYIKFIRQGKDDDHWSLESENENYQPRQFHLSKIRRIYKIKSVISRTSL